MRAAIATLVLLAAACAPDLDAVLDARQPFGLDGSGSDGPGPDVAAPDGPGVVLADARPADAPADGGCTVTLSGSLSASFPCRAGASSSGGQTTVSFAADPLPAGLSDWVANAAWPGAAQMRTYENGDFTSYTVFVMSTQNGFYAATRGGGAAQGTLRIVLTSVDGGTVHGTADATLPAEASSSGSVTAHLVF